MIIIVILDNKIKIFNTLYEKININFLYLTITLNLDFTNRILISLQSFYYFISIDYLHAKLKLVFYYAK